VTTVVPSGKVKLVGETDGEQTAETIPLSASNAESVPLNELKVIDGDPLVGEPE
jgi:hypothetical protein